MLHTIEEAITDIKKGKMIIVVDDENRENEGDFIMAGSLISAEAVNFMASFGRGMICTPITEETAVKLNLHPMVPNNTSSHETAFTVTVDAAKGISTGISASDRARTIALLADNKSEPRDFVRPGHIFPLIAKKGGVLTRNGHTEAAVDLARLAGLPPCGVICEITNADGTMARLPELRELAQKFNLKLISIEDLVQYRRANEIHMKHDETVDLPTDYGTFKLHTFIDSMNSDEYVVLTKDENVENPLVRIHSQCLTGDVFHSQKCDCGTQLKQAMTEIQAHGGAIIYQPQEGRGIGIINKIRAYKLQEQGLDTVDANRRLGLADDQRDYSGCAQILKLLGMDNIKLMTNNPDKFNALTSFGIEIKERVSSIVKANKNNQHYLSTKKNRMGHLLDESNIMRLQ